MGTQHSGEIDRGERFSFGENWERYLETLNDARILEAENSLREMLGLKDLVGKKFLDVGCGSGLFSLAASRMGAMVYSFDYDPNSVSCAHKLKNSFRVDDCLWQVEEGSVLDDDYMKNIGSFDIVCSWGVLHHTGHLEKALNNVMQAVKQDGLLYISIYNDQGFVSDTWRKIKRVYCSGLWGKYFVSSLFIPFYTIVSIAKGIVKDGNPLGYFVDYKKKRGMSAYYDWVDWLGGYPYEVAKPENVLELYMENGFNLVKLKTTNRLGCNQFVFRKESSGLV